MRLNEAYDKFSDKIDFYCIYVREAHPSDGWEMFENIDAGIVEKAPTNQEERADVAETCSLKVPMDFPMLLGDFDNQVELAYAALPVRIFVIDKDGVISYRTGMGPRGMDVDEALAAIEDQYNLS